MEAAWLSASPQPVERWLWPFLRAEYYRSCTAAAHDHTITNNKNSRCNFFCINCTTPICDYCRNSPQHQGHLILQIRRTSKACSVDEASIACLINTSGLHKFKINGYSIHFLVPRPSEGSKKKAPTTDHDSHCDFCGWILPGGVAHGSRFCSIYCKLADKSSPVPRQCAVVSVDRPSGMAVAAKSMKRRPTDEGGLICCGSHVGKRARKEVVVRNDVAAAQYGSAPYNYKNINIDIMNVEGEEDQKGKKADHRHEQQKQRQLLGDTKITAGTGMAALAGPGARIRGISRRKGVPRRAALF